MKNNLLVILAVFTISCKAQIYSLNDKTISRLDAPVGSYFKDLDGEYNKYIGLWKGNWNGKTVYLDLKKVKYKMDEIYIDSILGERKIISTNGTVEIDRISNFDYQHPEIWGMGPITGVNNGVYQSFMFYPKDMCGIYARLAIINITPTQMTLHLTAIMGGTDGNCIHYAYVQQHGEYPLNFPKDIVLTKQ